MEHRPTIFGTGLIALDFIMSADAEKPIRAAAGGTCANVLIIMSFLGWNSYPIARMNGDAASIRVKNDFKLWGVHTDFISCPPTTSTPIIIQEIKVKKDGTPTHRFSWVCPNCGQWLPAYKPVTKEATTVVDSSLGGARVFFMDRLSRAAIIVAEKIAASGGLVIYEPSCKSENPKLMSEALRLSHIIKYSNQRFNFVEGVMQEQAATLIEIKTLGEKGLQWRHKLYGKVSDWKLLPAIKSRHLADSCGSGDWCTAGLIAQVCSGGIKGLRKSGVKGINDALHFGQALAAWNCGFEGARGGMYDSSLSTFNAQIKTILDGSIEPNIAFPYCNLDSTSAIPVCPHCSFTAMCSTLCRVANLSLWL